MCCTATTETLSSFTQAEGVDFDEIQHHEDHDMQQPFIADEDPMQPGTRSFARGPWLARLRLVAVDPRGDCGQVVSLGQVASLGNPDERSLGEAASLGQLHAHTSAFFWIAVDGRRLGQNATDLLRLVIDGHDCTRDAKWISPERVLCQQPMSIPSSMGVQLEVSLVTQSGGHGYNQQMYITPGARPPCIASISPQRAVMSELTEVVIHGTRFGYGKESVLDVGIIVDMSEVKALSDRWLDMNVLLDAPRLSCRWSMDRHVVPDEVRCRLSTTHGDYRNRSAKALSMYGIRRGYAYVVTANGGLAINQDAVFEFEWGTADG